MFFVYNGVLLVCERLLETSSDSFFLKRWVKALSKLPRPIRTTLVLLLVLPIGHWFTDEYIQSSFFDDTIHAFPIIKLRFLLDT